MQTTFWFAIFVTLFQSPRVGSQPYPGPIRYVQPDGTELEIFSVEGGRLGTREGLAPRLVFNGYPVVKTRDRFEYALRGPDGGLIPSGLVVGFFQPTETSFERGIGPTRAFVDRVKSVRAAGRRPSMPGMEPGRSVEVNPPGGYPVRLRSRGSVDFAWFADPQGFTVILVPGRYVYAVFGEDGRLAPTELTVGQFDPERSGLPKDPSVK